MRSQSGVFKEFVDVPQKKVYSKNDKIVNERILMAIFNVVKKEKEVFKFYPS